MDIADFYKKHDGETCLLVGNGPNLQRTPPALFPFTSIGMNTIHLYEGWRPTYYTTVDTRVMREYGRAIIEKLGDIPKFIPRPNLDEWNGPNFYRFYRRPGEIVVDGHNAADRKALTSDGISWACIMHVAMQLAWHMGFTTILMIGIKHEPGMEREHFWGMDYKSPPQQPLAEWLNGYSDLVRSMSSTVKVLNISEDTCVPKAILPRGDWRKYAS